MPEKFKIDKRKLHLSALILAGQLSREEALKELEQPVYPKEQFKEDTEYVIKKFSLSEQEWEDMLNAKPKTFLDYPSQYVLHLKLRKTLSYLRKKKLFYN